MKNFTRSPTKKDRCHQWVSVGRQILHDQGGLLLGPRTRSIQALFGVILILVCTTLFMAVLAIGDSVSLKVRLGLTFKIPSRQQQLINRLQESGSTAVRFDSEGLQHRLIDWKPQLPTQQKRPEKGARAQVDHRTRNSKKSGSKRDNDSSAGRHLDVLDTSKSAAWEETELDDHMHNGTLHHGNLSTSTTRAQSSRHDNSTSRDRPQVEGGPARWLQFPGLYPDNDETEQLMLQIRQNGTLPCHEIRTKSGKILGLPEPVPKMKVTRIQSERDDRVIQLQAGPVYEFSIVSIGDDDQPRCQGGDYYETDLSGPLWRSRPPVVDLHNGTYAVQLQMDPRFAGRYTFTAVLLFSNFHALHFHPQKYARMEEIAAFEIDFLGSDEIAFAGNGSRPEDGPDSSNSTVPEDHSRGSGPPLSKCGHEDFERKHWSGRWTREKFNEDCEYDKYGLWRCVDRELPCQAPWCEGPVGSLESNGWVYSAHCAFKIFRKEEAWKCLEGKWLFFWGDSNHIDTIRNLLNFVLGFENSVRFLDRRMDMTFSFPPDNRSSVRITSMFNGHSNVSLNYEGLYSLHNEEYASQLRSYFDGETAPDFMIMNSGLHDGLYWRSMNAFLEDGVEYAARFWTDVWANMTARRPDLLYRTTVATGGQSRNMSFNPHKMELFNHIIVDKFIKMKLERFKIIDGFDYTFPWHWDHKTNDGVHYGRPPAKTKWAGNNVGHRYFVDLMLVHMLLNAFCPQN